jgi:hypothetical protein
MEAGITPRIVPWNSWEEWEEVRSSLYSQDSSQVRKAIEQVSDDAFGE